MSDPFQNLFSPAQLKTYLYPPNSRYFGVDTAQLETAGGRTVTFLRRRFVPPPERFQMVKEHEVQQGERLDLIAAKEIGDPLLFWRICDANRAIRPDDLIETAGRRLRITLPEGISGG
jgi:hypothetical protein